ncbi:hypothetical protein NEILACOT_04686 [Neisseria lactamica ATCC 23970]|uniref:Uncharacterized protein n=1 Tax=Neisseria lactamica ATCC 23970 TaxID=546265 RepID=D0WAW3_NEILA|nr:hypothetical protein NEILACOT_04686 [Neisseria lactamica ATCC 23970]
MPLRLKQSIIPYARRHTGELTALSDVPKQGGNRETPIRTRCRLKHPGLQTAFYPNPRPYKYSGLTKIRTRRRSRRQYK